MRARLCCLWLSSLYRGGMSQLGGSIKYPPFSESVQEEEWAEQHPNPTGPGLGSTLPASQCVAVIYSIQSPVFDEDQVTDEDGRSSVQRACGRCLQRTYQDTGVVLRYRRNTGRKQEMKPRDYTTTPPEISPITGNFLGLLGFQGQHREQPSHNQGMLNICIKRKRGISSGWTLDHGKYETTASLR